MSGDLVFKIESATSENNTSENWEAIIGICEEADSSEYAAREAVGALSKRMLHRNVNVSLYALTVANSLVQNCGIVVKRQIASRVFLDPLIKLVNTKSTHPTLKNRILELIQTWAEEFHKDLQLSFMVDSFNTLRTQGHSFPSASKPPADYRPPNPEKSKEDEELQLAIALSLSVKEQVKPVSSRQQQQPGTMRTPTTSKKSHLFVVKALYDFAGSEEGELHLNRGDLVKVYDNSTFKDWWKGECRGTIGIFPCNYVEMASEDPGSATSTVPGSGVGGVGTSLESDVLLKSAQIDKFTSILGSIDPARTNPSDHTELQEKYHTILTLRPSLIKLVETYKGKQEELSAANERFLAACATYHRLMDSGMRAQQRPVVNNPPQTGYYQQQQPQQQYAQQPVSAPSGVYGSAPQDPYYSQQPQQGYSAPDPYAGGYAPHQQQQPPNHHQQPPPQQQFYPQQQPPY